MKTRNVWLSLLLAGTLSAETAIDLKNGDFEQKGDGWDYGKMVSFIEEAPHGGKFCLRILDESPTEGSSCRSTAMPVTVGKTYAVRFWARNNARRGAVGVYMQFLNDRNKQLNTDRKSVV